MKKVVTFSRRYGERAPQHIQNIVLRNYLRRITIFLLSSVEYKT